jgi:hypothetical protein
MTHGTLPNHQILSFAGPAVIGAVPDPLSVFALQAWRASQPVAGAGMPRYGRESIVLYQSDKRQN